MTRTVLLDRLAMAIAGVRLDHPTRVAIDGVDGAGKTALPDELVGPLVRTGRQVLRASIDGFHCARALRYTRGAQSPEGYYLDSFDYARLKAALLDPLGPVGNRCFRQAVFDHRTDQPLEVPQRVAAADAILLFDGVFLQRPELETSWDLRIWVDAPFEVTVPRAVNRDTGGADEGGITRMKYERRYVPGQLLYLNQWAPKEAASIVVNNSDFENPELYFQTVV